MPFILYKRKSGDSYLSSQKYWREFRWPPSIGWKKSVLGSAPAFIYDVYQFNWYHTFLHNHSHMLETFLHSRLVIIHSIVFYIFSSSSYYYYTSCLIMYKYNSRIRAIYSQLMHQIPVLKATYHTRRQLFCILK